jgi:hypothetical protein
MTNTKTYEKKNCFCSEGSCFCWNGSDDSLEHSIHRSKFVNQVRKELSKKKLNTQDKFRKEIIHSKL